MKLKIDRAYSEIVVDDHPDASFLEQTGLGFEDRLEAYRNGDFHFVGVRAVAELLFETDVKGGWIRGPILKSPGLWGIESDSGDVYFAEVAAEEAEQLQEMLEALGVSQWKARYAKAIAATTVEAR